MIPMINAPWPRKALKFFVRQQAYLSPIQSRQQEHVVTCVDAATISAYNIANPLAPCSIEIAESQTFYTFGNITFWSLRTGDYVPAPNDEGRCNLIATAGWTAPQVATGFIAQINAYARSMHQLTNGYYDTLSAVPYAGFPNAFLLRMPIGTDGAATAVTQVGPVVASARWNGVTVPLAYGIIGPRRHVFSVPYPVPPQGIG
jgi:hypothetical protein